MAAVHWGMLQLTRVVFHEFPLNGNFCDFFFNRNSSALQFAYISLEAGSVLLVNCLLWRQGLES